jgi:hypothetical protein
MPAVLRVLHVLPSLRPGGAERIAVDIVTRLDRQRFLPFLISISRPVGSDLERTLADAGVQFWYLGKGSGFDARIYRRMHQAFDACRPDILHTHIDVLRYALPSLLYWKSETGGAYGSQSCRIRNGMAWARCATHRLPLWGRANCRRRRSSEKRG